jgi:hypothetical protein
LARPCGRSAGKWHRSRGTAHPARPLCVAPGTARSSRRAQIQRHENVGNEAESELRRSRAPARSNRGRSAAPRDRTSPIRTPPASSDRTTVPLRHNRCRCLRRRPARRTLRLCRAALPSPRCTERRRLRALARTDHRSTGSDRRIVGARRSSRARPPERAAWARTALRRLTRELRSTRSAARTCPAPGRSTAPMQEAARGRCGGDRSASRTGCSRGRPGTSRSPPDRTAPLLSRAFESTETSASQKSASAGDGPRFAAPSNATAALPSAPSTVVD